MNDIEISIICNTYNQVHYIDKALESLVAQKTSVPFEIIVHDDCSTDGTVNVVRKYEKMYPSLVRVFVEIENQYSRGKNITRDILLPHIRGKYIALCEGDDYWIDDTKIQKQWEAMEHHKECDMCACRSIIVEENGKTIKGEVRPNKCNSILPPEKVIVGGGRYIATPSLFYRKSLYDMKTQFESVISFDFTLQIKGSLRGGIYYIDYAMAAYRDLAKGSWSLNVARDRDKIKKHYEREIRMLEVLDYETEGRYHDSIEKRIEAYTPFYDQLMNHREEFLNELASCRDGIWIWGMGLRGDAAQKFCKNEKIVIDGVCDKQNTGLGEKTEHGQVVDSTENCLKKSKAILASNNIIYNYLIDEGYPGVLINLQKYMPLS
ncbi:MAG: glycosyltransferase [Lachnospiraceae bacterium]|nr:glycosyltransferase [Lachnospiraceae bacterium]